MFKKILNGRSKSIASAAFVVGFLGLLSRLTGLIRDRVLAGQFGAGDTLDIYYAAFRLPDLVFNLLVLGAISAAFVPVFLETYRDDKQKGWRLANETLNLIIFVLTAVSVIFILFTPSLIDVFTPGFDASKKELAIRMTRLMFLSPLFLGISAFVTGLLQTFRRFLVSAIAPVMYNLGIILGALFFTDFFGIYGLAVGVIFGAILHLFIQLPVIFEFGFRPEITKKFWTAGTKKIVQLMIPRSLGLAVFQVNLFIMTAFASSLRAGSLAIFNLADNFQAAPAGVIGFAFSTAVFPSLAAAYAKKRLDIFKTRFSFAFNQVIFFTLPVSFLFFILRHQIVGLVLGTGKFSWTDVRLTAAVLGLFTLGMLAQSLVSLLSKSFFAVQDTKTPLIISALSIGLNLLLAFFFVYLFSFPNFLTSFFAAILDLKEIKDIRILALPLALSVSAIFNFIVSATILFKKIGGFEANKIIVSFLKTFFACIVMSLAVYPILYLLNFIVSEQTFKGSLIQGFFASLSGGLVYFGFAIILKLPEAESVLLRLKIFFKKQKS